VNRDARISLLGTAYEAFNRRDIEAVLELLDPEVEWPDMLQGRTLTGVGAVRDYWEKQFETIRSTVEPREFIEREEVIVVVVHQLVRDNDGALLAEGEVEHHYEFRDARIARMTVVARET
jgi:ketosteroid isomerase-like protein